MKERTTRNTTLIWIVPVIMILLMLQIHGDRIRLVQVVEPRTITTSTTASSSVLPPQAAEASVSGNVLLPSDNENSNVQQHQGGGGGEKTALVMRTMAPLHPLVLERIYDLAVLGHDSPEYDFWILVDETKNNKTEQLLDLYFRKRRHHGHDHDGTNTIIIQPPQVFSVSESILIEHYPRIVSYFYNEPEINFHNESGLCCGRGMMWQTFIPTFAIFMTSQNETYKFAWTIEDDVSTHGQYSIYDIIHIFDEELHLQFHPQNENDTTVVDDDIVVDLAAVRLPKLSYWGGRYHTWPMEHIVNDMRNVKVPWYKYSDAIQRHSFKLAQSVYTEVRDNHVMQFGESLIWPIAWKHNHTVVNLATLAQTAAMTQNRTNTKVGSIYGLLDLTGQKLTKAHGVIGLLNTPNDEDDEDNDDKNSKNKKYSSSRINDTTTRPTTFIFHEEIPLSLSGNKTHFHVTRYGIEIGR